MKDLKKRRQRVEEKEEKEKSKDKEIKRQIKIFQKRAKELEYGLVKAGEGGIMSVKWKGKNYRKIHRTRIARSYSM
jgi:ribosome-binding ATPase YchF (GTP1/OBG family)